MKDYSWIKLYKIMIGPLVIPFLQIHFDNQKMAELTDKELSAGLNTKDMTYKVAFQQRFKDQLLYIARSFCNMGQDIMTLKYKTKKRGKYYISDCVSGAYLFLAKEGIRIAKKYKGDNGASLDNYLLGSLNNNWSLTNWLRWREDDNLVRNPKQTSRLPSCIKKLSNVHHEIFKKLRFAKNNEFTYEHSEHQICHELSLSRTEYYEYYLDIEEALLSTNQHMLIYRKKGYQEIDEVSSPYSLPEFSEIKNIMDLIRANLSDAQDRLLIMCYCTNYKNNEIQDFVEDENNNLLNEALSELDINFSKRNAIDHVIKKILSRSIDFVKENHPSYMRRYHLEYNKLKRVMRIYYQYFLENERQKDI